MQRPRCLYFRDVSAACNRRTPGAGCAAHRRAQPHARDPRHQRRRAWPPTRPTSRWRSSRSTPSVITRDANGEKPIPVADFFRQPGNTPDHEHNLRPGELITAVDVPPDPRSRRSGYLKVRDRSPTSSRSPRRPCHSTSRRHSAHRTVAAGGVGDGAVAAARRRAGPDRAGRASAGRCGIAAAAAAADGAKPLSDNGFKVELIKRTVERQLATVAGDAMTHPLPAADSSRPTDGPRRRQAQGDRQAPLRGRQPGARTGVTRSLVCSTVARGAVDRIDSRPRRTQPDVLRVLDRLPAV